MSDSAMDEEENEENEEKHEKDEDDAFFDDGVFAQLDELLKAHEEKKTLSQAALSQQPDAGAQAAAAAPRETVSNLRPADLPPRPQLPPAGPFSSQQQQQQQQQWNPGRQQHPHVHQHNPQQQQQQQQQWNPSQHNPQHQQQHQQQQQQQWNPSQQPPSAAQQHPHNQSNPPYQQQQWNPTQQQQQQQQQQHQHQHQQQQQWNPSQQPPSATQQHQHQQWLQQQQQHPHKQQQQHQQQQHHQHQQQQQQPWREPLQPPHPNGFLPRQGPQGSHHLPPGSVSREAASLSSHNAGPGASSTAASGSSSHSHLVPPQHNPDLERRLAQEEGTNTLLRQKLEAAEQSKFELQRRLNMQQASTQQGDPQVSVEELSGQLRSIQQQLQHAQAEADEAKREGRERDLRLQEATRRSQENQEELDKVRQVKQQLEQELEDANRERRARATQASTPLSLTQPAEDAQARMGPPLSGAKRRRNSGGGCTTPGPPSGAAAMQVSPIGSSRGALGLVSPAPPAATPQQQQRQQSQQRTPHRQQQQHPLEPAPPPPWGSLAPVPPRASSEALGALLSECCDDLYVLMGCGGRQAAPGAPHLLLLPEGFPLEPPRGSGSSSEGTHAGAEPMRSGSIDSLDRILAARVCRDLQGMASGAMEPVNLCRTLAQHVIAYSSAPEATAAPSSALATAGGPAPAASTSAAPRVSAPFSSALEKPEGGDKGGSSGGVVGGGEWPRRRAAVWEFGEPRAPPDHGTLKAALEVAGCLIAHDSASRTELLRLCGCSGELRDDTGGGGGGAMMESDITEDDRGDGRGPGSSQPAGELLAALLRVAARLLGSSSSSSSSEAQGPVSSAVLAARPTDADALSAVVGALGRLLEAALEETGGAGDIARLTGTRRCQATEKAFCRLMSGGDGRETLRPLLRSDSPEALRAAVLRLVSGRAAASAELLRLWGLDDTTAAAVDPAAAGEDGRPTMGLSQFPAGAEKRAGGGGGRPAAAAASASSGGAPHLADLILDNLLVDPSAAGAPSIGASGVCIAEQLQASLSLGPFPVHNDAFGGITSVGPQRQFEAARAALEVVAALVEHSQWPALRHLIARGLGQNLSAALDASTRDPPQPSGSQPTPPSASAAASSFSSSSASSAINSAVLESLRTPASLLLLSSSSSSSSSGGGDLAHRNRGAAPPLHPQARRLAAERLRLAQEVLLLLDALLSDRRLEWPLLDDLCASSASLRLCLTTTTRLSAAIPMQQHQQQPSSPSSSSRGSPPPLHQAAPGLPLSPWASALLLRSSSASSSASATPSSATSAPSSAPRQHPHRRRDDSSCRGVLFAAPGGCCSHRLCSLQEVARTAARVRLKVLQSQRPDAHNGHHQP